MIAIRVRSGKRGGPILPVSELSRYYGVGHSRGVPPSALGEFGMSCRITLGLLLGCFFVISTTSSHEVRAADRGSSKPRLGINLAGPADWNTELPFADVFRFARPWISQRKGSPWGKGPELDLDERGWVRRLEPDCWAETALCTIEGGHYPSGRYTVRFSGKGRIAASGAARVVESTQGRVVLEVEARRGGFFLRLEETDPADPVREIRVLMPGFSELVREAPWNPAFLARWRGLACLRFMDLMETNRSEIVTWADRPVIEDATWARRGVPVELLVDLANRLDADAWLCIPHAADDDYVARLADLVAQRFYPSRKV
jgi:hypothetical protein